MKNIKNKKFIGIIVVAVISILLEIFAFNFSSWYAKNVIPVTIASNVTTNDNWEYESETIILDSKVKNINVDASVKYLDTAYISVVLTDAGNKYPYETSTYTLCNGVNRSGFSNVYPFGKVHSIQVKIKSEEGCPVDINSIVVNAHIPVSVKPIRLLVVFVLLLFGYLVFSESKLHEIYYDEKKVWQKIVTLLVMISVMLIGIMLARSDKFLMTNPWPHHLQYQELARSLKAGTVELIEQPVDPKILDAPNPYDTVALYVDGIEYSMDYTYFNGKYYAYFGIVPEIMCYYPWLMITGKNLQNYQMMMILSVVFTFSMFWLVDELVRKYSKSLPYFFYILLSVVTSLSANFVYLISRPDIYNIPIMFAIMFSAFGFAAILHSLGADKKAAKCVCIALGAISLALVAGCRPQFLLLSGVAIIWLMFEDGFKNRKIFTKDTIAETALFIVPYVLVAILVCWYNYARFGNIFDFGATYSLTTNDMNNRGFNMNRLLRSLYCYMLQPAVINTDYPFLNPSYSGGNYMGKFLYEYTYGGILVTNTILVSLWIAVVTGFKKINKSMKMLVGYLAVSAVVIGAFDANSAGVLYRYTCDFVLAFIVAATVLWICFLDKSQNVITYKWAAKAVYICAVLALIYSLLTFVASGDSVCLLNDNKRLFFAIADYFKF